MEVTTSTRRRQDPSHCHHDRRRGQEAHRQGIQGVLEDAYPGFRAGKAPRKVIEQNFGGHDAVYAQITSDLINDVAPLAIDGQDIIFIGEPASDDNPFVADGEGLHLLAVW